MVDSYKEELLRCEGTEEVLTEILCLCFHYLTVGICVAVCGSVSESFRSSYRLLKNADSISV